VPLLPDQQGMVPPTMGAEPHLTGVASPTQLLVAGSLPDIVEDQFARLFAQLGIPRVDFLPARRRDAMPSVGPGTRVLLAQPFLAETLRCLVARGAQHLAAPYPFGAEGTANWVRVAARAFGIPDARLESVIGPARERARTALSRQRALLQGRRLMFFPDSQLEVPLARFAAEELGMSLVEVGTPYLHRGLLADELERLPPGTLLQEGGDVDAQLQRCRAARPDLVVCGLGLANPLEAEGITTKWSIELVFSPIHGFEQAGDLAALLSRPLDRRSRLAA
jgi:light-independent protochlorophyllide reductase subunit N